MRQPNNVYVLGNPGVGLVKIGIAVDVDRRLSEIICGYVPMGISRSRLMPLRVYGTSYARGLESQLHDRYVDVRMDRSGRIPGDHAYDRGWSTEWFALGSEALPRIDVSVWLWQQTTTHAIKLEQYYSQ